MTRRLVCALLALAAACGGDDGAQRVDACAAVTAWYEAVADASNDFSRAGHDLDDPARRRLLYLEAFDEMIDLTSDLTDQVGGEADLRDALTFAREVLDDERAEAADLPDTAYETRAVPGGSLFTASERARATVSSAARGLCSELDR